VIVLDSFAVLALFRDEPAAPLVQQLVESEQDVALTALGVSEVLDHLVRILGAEEDEAVLDLAQLSLTPPISVDLGVATQAGLLRARHYHRKSRAVSLADCVASVSAQVAAAQLASADPHLLDMCQEEGIAVVALPDSTGHTWSPQSTRARERSTNDSP
jgi:predicted nucleic acid-binding protein